MNLIARKMILLSAPKFIRQALATLGAWMAAHGATAEQSIGSVIVGLLIIAGTMIWSYVAKRPPNTEDDALLRNLATAAASQLVPALCGLLVSKGWADSSTNADSGLEGVILFALNHYLSTNTRPDAKAKG